MQRFVEAKVTLPGLHRWPLAPPELSHLAQYHRHLFVIRVSKAVLATDREVEFQKLAWMVRSYLEDSYPQLYADNYSIDGLNFGHRSCEMLAEELVQHFDLAWCSVHEDDENGAMVLQ